MSRVKRAVDACRSFADRHRVVSRLALVWAMALTTFVVERVTRPEVLDDITGSGATVATAAIGILSTVVGLYQKVTEVRAETLREHNERSTD